MRIRWVGRQATVIAIALRAGAIAAALVLAGLLLVWGIDLGKRVSGAAHQAPAPNLTQQVASLQAELAAVETERARLGAIADTVPGDAAQRDKMSIQIKALEADNAKLLDDLAEFATKLTPGKASVTIHRAEAALTAPQQLHVRMLLTATAKEALGGHLELLLVGSLGGVAQTLVFPGSADGTPYAVGPGQFQRIDLMLSLPQGFTVKSLSARVLEQGRVRVQQAVPLRSS